MEKSGSEHNGEHVVSANKNTGIYAVRADTVWVDMIRLGKGCTGNCPSCGAYQGGYSPEHCQVVPISEEQLEANISQTIFDDVAKIRIDISNLFRSYVTAGIDMEPLESDIFYKAAERIYEKSKEREGGRSHLVAISHGLRLHESSKDANDTLQWHSLSNQEARLKKIVDLMLKDIIPLFVLTIDNARDQGLPGETARKCQEEILKMEEVNSPFMQIINQQAIEDQKQDGLTDGIQQESPKDWQKRLADVKKRILYMVNEKLGRGEEGSLNDNEKIIKEYIKPKDLLRKLVTETNARAYAATVDILIPAIEAEKRVAFSLQGEDREESMVSMDKTLFTYQKMMHILQTEYGYDSNFISDHVSVWTRFYTSAGRARDILHITDHRPCTVIPDQDFVMGRFRRDIWRAKRVMINYDGKLLVQAYRAKRTYNDTANGFNSDSDNPWKPVDVIKSEPIDLSRPIDFLARMKVHSIPLTTVPEIQVEEGKLRLRTVYPLSCITDKQKRDAVIGKLWEYLCSCGYKGNVEERELQDVKPENIAGLFCLIVEALIPDEVIQQYKKDGETDLIVRKRLAEEIIQMNVPVLEPPDEINSRKMGEILAVQVLLKELGIDIKLEDRK